MKKTHRIFLLQIIILAGALVGGWLYLIESSSEPVNVEPQVNQPLLDEEVNTDSAGAILPSGGVFDSSGQFVPYTNENIDWLYEYE